jgi:lipopolysaccharide transport system ATP-binding protein
MSSTLAEPHAPPDMVGQARPDPPRAAAGGDVMIRAAALGKCFKIYPRPWARLVEWVTLGRAVEHEDFWALSAVTFDVRRGEALGVIGVNGSGKSTLLKILSGAMYPTTGTFDVTGRVLSLLELGTGMNPELTGRQNVTNSSQLLAFPPGYAEQRMGEIEAFAELGEFFDRPVRLYSDGMKVRLVFSMFACFDPDVFVVDEALSVGDLHFQQKCSRRIREMLNRGVTMLFVSHDLGAVESLCDRVMVMHKGAVKFVGDKRRGIQLYYSLVGAGLHQESVPDRAPIEAPEAPAAATPPTAGPPPERDGELPPFDESAVAALPWQAPDAADLVGDGRVRIIGVCYRRDDGTHTQVLERGQSIDLFVRYEAAAEVGPVNCGLAVYDRLSQLLFAVNWLNAGVEPLWVKPGDQWAARFRVKADLEPGEYTLWLGASEALRDPESHTGWNQHLGGERFVGLPRAGKIAVLPRSDKRRTSFGPANLQYEISRVVMGPEKKT